MRKSEDYLIIRRVLAGEVDAYGALVDRYQGPIFNLMYRMTGSYEDSRDLGQETFLRAFEKLGSFDEEKRFFPWLYAIGMNLAKNFLKRNKTHMQSTESSGVLDTEMGSVPSGEDRMMSRLDGELVRDALNRIPADYREAVVLYYHEDLSMQEISVALGLSVSGAKMRVHRGLKKLRELICTDEN